MLLLKVLFEAAIAYVVIWVIVVAIGIAVAKPPSPLARQESGEEKLRKLGY